MPHIKGIGNDIIEIARIVAVMERHESRFLNRIFSKEEAAYCAQHVHPAPHFAGRFAAKEAIVKALGVGFRMGIHWLDIGIINDAFGKPEVFLSEKVRALVGPVNCLVSISHCKQFAMATAICLES